MRLIDDALEGGQNGATGSQFTHRPTDLDSWPTQCRMVQERFPQSALSQFPSDFKKAYKPVPAQPSLAGFAVMVQWHPQKRCPAFLVGRTQFFGGKSCPVNFARVPDWCCHALATMAGLATSHCVDDVLAVDRKTTIFSGWLVWRVLAACCGWVVPDAKSPFPSQVHRILGATSDLSQTPCGPPTLSISQDRVAQLTSMVKDVLVSGHLHPAMAGKLWERLGFSCTQMFGRFGRAKLRRFSRRQHEHRRFWLNHQLTSALKWWLQILSCSPPRLVPTDLSARRRIVSYSDGEGSEAGVGVALWESGTQVVRAGVLRVPEEVRILWDRQKNLGRFNDIFLRSKRKVLWSCSRTSRTCSGVLCGFTFLTMRLHYQTWSMDRHPSSKETS